MGRGVRAGRCVIVWLAAKLEGDFPEQRRTQGCAQRKAADGHGPSEDLQVGAAPPWQMSARSKALLSLLWHTEHFRSVYFSRAINIEIDMLISYCIRSDCKVLNTWYVN